MADWWRQERIQNYTRLLVRVVLSLVLLWVAVRWLPGVLVYVLPFLLAYLAASAFNPLISYLKRRWRVPRNLSAVGAVLVSLLVVAGIIGGLVFALVRELLSLAQNIDEVTEFVFERVEGISGWVNNTLQVLPIDFTPLVYNEDVRMWLAQQGNRFADAVLSQTAGMATRFGEGAIATLFFIMAAYFMMADYPNLQGKLRNVLTRPVYERCHLFKEATLTALGGYLRAQLLMAVIAFVFMLVGLLVVGQEFAVLLAVILAFVDLLPIVGMGAVLVPWGVVVLLSGDIFMGLYLIGLSLVFFFVRRVLEPKIMSTQSGISPLTVLLSLYVGMRLSGLWGLILGPLCAMVLVALYKAGAFEGWRKDVCAVVDSMAKNNSSG